MKPATLEAATAKFAELTEIHALAMAEIPTAAGTGTQWPALAKAELERWGASLERARKWLAYAERDGALFDERRTSLEAARATLAACIGLQSRGTPDAKRALELEQAVVAARAALYHVLSNFPVIFGSLNGFPTNEIEDASKKLDRAAIALERAARSLAGIENHPGHARARAHLGILRAEAKPSRKMRAESFAKYADRIVQDVPAEIRPYFAVVALEELARYRAERPNFDKDDFDRDGAKKGLPFVEPPTVEELARHFGRFFEHQEVRDAQKAKLAAKEKAKIKADQEKQQRESAIRSELRTNPRITNSIQARAVIDASHPAPQLDDEAEHAKGAPPMPGPPPGRTV